MVTGAHRHIIVCHCGASEHQAILTYLDDDEDGLMYMHVHLTAWEGFFRRLWAGLKYAFGYHCRYGHWDEIIIDVDEAIDIRNFIWDFIESALYKD